MLFVYVVLPTGIVVNFFLFLFLYVFVVVLPECTFVAIDTCAVVSTHFFFLIHMSNVGICVISCVCPSSVMLVLSCPISIQGREM